MLMRRILLALILLLALLPGASALMLRGGSAAVTPVITFNAPSASYIYPEASGGALTTVTATVSPGSFLGGGGSFTSVTGTTCSSRNIAVASAGAVTVAGPSNLTGATTCTITANYPGAVSVSQTFTLTGTQQTIASISPCSLSGGCSYGFTVPATALTLGAVPSVAMSGGISFSAGGGTIALGTGSQCSDFAISGSNLQITASSAAIYACTYVITDANASNSPQTVNISANGTVAGTVGSLSFVNNGSGSTPGSTFPVHVLKTFAPGDVPVGQIAVPSVGGVGVAYGVDCAVDGVNPLRTDGCPSWPDGSLKAIPVSMFIPQLASGATEQVVFTKQSGSYNTTPGVTPATVIAASDYNVVLTDANSGYVLQPYGVWPNGLQIGCQVVGGSVPTGASGCNLRVLPPTASATGNNCAVTNATIPPAIGITAKIDNGSGSPGNILTVTAGAPQGAGGWVRGEILTDSTSAIAANTVITTQITGVPGSTGTYNVSGSAQLVASEQMGFQGCSGRISNGINNTGGGTPAIFTTTLGSNGMPTAINVVAAGSGYTNYGTLKFDVNTLLNLYGTVQPPTCAAEQGAGTSTSATYSAGAVTFGGTITGHFAKGQIVKDSTGATAIITGSSSPWTISTNTGGSATLTSGAMTANTPVCMWAASSYAGQPLKTSYWVFGPYINTGTGLPDAQLMGSAQVDIWSLSGSTYSVRAIVRTDREGWQPGQYWQSYTYNADIMNGTAEVRGNAQGTGIYTGLTDEVPGAWWTVDPALAGPIGASARPDWLGATPNSFSESNSLAINSVSMYLGSSDIAYWRGSHAMLPLASNVTPTPTIIPASSGGPWDDPIYWQGYYMPFGPMFVNDQSAFGSGGDHFFLSPQGAALSFWIDLTNQASDKGVSWLQQMRVSGLAISSDVSGWSESDTEHALNIDPNFSNSAFTDPSRLNWLVGDPSNGGGYEAPPLGAAVMAVGGQVNVEGDISQSDHWPSGSLLGPYLIDGEYYQLKEMDLQIGQAEGSSQDVGHRTLAFGGNNYYGILWNNTSRVYAWGLTLVNQFVNFAPPQEPDAQYWNWIKNHDNYASYAAWFPYTGSFSFGLGSTTGTKVYDWSAGGGCQGMRPTFLSGTAPYNIGEVTWMCGYALMDELLDWLWAGGPGNNTALDTIVAEGADRYLIKEGSQNSCPYNAVNYTQQTGNLTTTAPVTYFDNTDIPGSPPTGYANGYSEGVAPTEMTSTVSSSTLTFATVGNNGPNPLPTGSIITPTQWATEEEESSAPVPPSPLVQGTWYKWCLLTTTPTITGTINPYSTLCSSPAPITIASAATFAIQAIPNQSCPATGDWTFSFDFPSNIGYSSTYWAVMNWRAAVGGSTSDTTTAISNFSLTGITNPSIWTQQPRWNACTSFTC
jgi:hypothetical protein